MSHSVTITRTVTSSNTTSTLVLNTGYIKTLPGLLKLAQLILGAACVGILAYYYDRGHSILSPDLFFLLITTSFLIGTFCLLVSCLFSLSTGGIISKTIYELIYHSIAAVLILIASAYLLAKIDNYKHYTGYKLEVYDKFIVAGVLGLINVILYIWSAVLARRSYKGI